MKTSHKQVETKVLKSSRGKIFFAEDFDDYGTPENIRQVLSRLEQEGVLRRIAHGIYLKPKIDAVIGEVMPSVEEIAKEIAKRDRVQIIPTGVTALLKLGLTTQVPLKAVYLTDGSPRQIKIGKRTIKFKRTVPKTFAIKNGQLQLIVQALKEKGQKNIEEGFLIKLKPSVEKLDAKVIEKELKFAPVWIQKVIKNINK